MCESRFAVFSIARAKSDLTNASVPAGTLVSRWLGGNWLSCYAG